MMHFAQIDANNIVTLIESINDQDLIEDGVSKINRGLSICEDSHGGRWVYASKHGAGSKNFAQVGFTYDEAVKQFIPPQPFDSWTLDANVYKWVAPVPMPEFNTETQSVHWDEANLQWVVE